MSHESEGNELLRQARAHDNSGDFQAAERLYKQAHEADPLNVDALNGLGGVALKLRRLEDAEGYLKQSLEIDPHQSATNRLLGQLESALRNHGKAQAYFTTALEIDPQDKEVANLLEGAKTYVRLARDPDYSVAASVPWNSDDWVWEERTGNSDIVVVFSGLGVNTGPPTFVFHTFFKTYEHIDKVFIRDLDKLWYLRRIGNAARGVEEIAEFIRRKTEGYQRVFFLGCSAGATAALLYSRFVKPDKIVAFSPQTALNSAKEIECMDFRWPQYIDNLRHEGIDPKYLDLNSMGPFTSPIDIHFSAGCEPDRRHAQRVSGKHLRCIPHEGNGHVVAMHLRDTGKLRAIIDAEIDE